MLGLPLCGALCGHGGAGGGRAPEAGAPGAAAENLALARRVLAEAFAELEAQCREERAHYEAQGRRPPPQSAGRWALYLGPRAGACRAALLDFVRGHPECRARPLPARRLRLLLLLQHRVAEDTSDFYRPPEERRHNDTFQGILTENGVNSQLVKDAHRSDWSIEGRPFTMQLEDAGTAGADPKDRRRQIQEFQRGLVTALEACLLGFSSRWGLSELATLRLLQAVTTQMSQCGLANLDRSSQAAGYFVGGLGLEQRTTYNLSTAEAEGLGEALQLSLCCLKTGFTHFHTEEALLGPGAGGAPEWDEGPCPCAPSSYLYQYATLRFAPRQRGDPQAEVECTVLDVLDEVHIVPPCVEGWRPL